MVKTFIKTAFLISTVSFLGCALHVAAPPPAPEQGKVAVCHKGKNTLYVDDNAVKAHLKHGDYLGPCR
ncbi:MAG: hypothetical protein PHO83_17280 [Geobacteraceae bacterium]|nr:hypothetical protein [Geobacteraceae bacterium]